MSSATAQRAYIFGYGVYEGMHPFPSGFDHYYLCVEGHDNPRIKLDSGEEVWGCMCWWGPEESMKRWIGDREVIEVPVPKPKVET